jgi:hypothetical protein
MQMLGLSVCSKVPIGNIFKKGISGGQKRFAIRILCTHE